MTIIYKMVMILGGILLESLYKIHSKNILIGAIGAFFNAFGVNCFILSSKLGEGGTIGLSLILKYTLELSPALTSLIINIIVIMIGWKYLSKQTAIYTLITVVITSIFLDLTEPLTLGLNDPMVNAIFAGAFIGIGAGLIIASGSTLGGPSVIAKIINKYFNIKTSKAIFILDSLIVLSFLLVLPVIKVLFTIIMLFITEKATAFIIEGFNPKKAVTIISTNHEIIGNKINHLTGKGATLIKGKGTFSHENVDVLYVVVHQAQITKIKNIVLSEDEDAFVVIHDVRDVLGKGFMNLT